jgi:hypothetical protein
MHLDARAHNKHCANKRPQRAYASTARKVRPGTLNAQRLMTFIEAHSDLSPRQRLCLWRTLRETLQNVCDVVFPDVNLNASILSEPGLVDLEFASCLH